jgi:hypothetical protein
MGLEENSANPELRILDRCNNYHRQQRPSNSQTNP